MTSWSICGITRALLPLLLALSLLEIVGSGLVLAQFEAALLQYPSLLVLVPVMIGTAGNLGSILAARTSTAFHLGTLSLNVYDDHLRGNSLLTLVLAVSVFPLVGAGGWLLTGILGQTTLSPVTVITIATISGVLLAVLAIIVTFVATYVAYQMQLDPDDIVIPVVTNVCDVLGVLVLFIVTQLLVPV
ncbi:magnesium transporter [Halorussus sp. AFM4]|uniref:magnesium transporter n=1 Tax=Halorussus sp. AFM4 TaxID=3421651 RepID=UPI003EBBAD16